MSFIKDTNHLPSACRAASDRNNIAYIKQLVEDQAIVPGDVKMNPQVKDKAFAKVIAQVRKDAEKEAASMSRPFLKATREEGPKKVLYILNIIYKIGCIDESCRCISGKTNGSY